MYIVVDTNVLISAIVKDSKSRELLVKVPETVLLSEIVLHELREHSKDIITKSQLSEKEFIDLLRLLLKRMVLVPVERTKPYKIEAIQIMKEIDIDDAFLIATALAFSNAVIWSEDADLKRQNVVKVLNTKGMSS